MITRITFYNFKSLQDVRCKLSRLTVIVGPNASGKTSMLQGLDLLSRLSKHHTTEDLLRVFSGAQNLDLLHSTDGREAMLLRCDDETSTFGFHADMPPAEFDPLTLPGSSWHVEFYCDQYHFGLSESDWSDRNSVMNEIATAAFLQFDPSVLALPSYSGDVSPTVSSRGDGLASALASMALGRPEVFESLQNRLRQIVPQFRRLRFGRVKVGRDESEVIRIIGEEAITRKVTREYPADTLIFDFDQRQDIPATNVSEGTMLALGLLTVLHSPSRPRIVLLDDIEKGLHPNAQRELIGLLRDILRNQPDLQIVATSHSPYFLDFLDPSEVRLMAIGADGFSRCGMLTDHPEFEKWKDEMTPGEMWSFFGEKWLVEEKV